MANTTVPFLRLSPARSSSGESIVLLLGRHLPTASDGVSAAASVAEALSELPPGRFVLVYCHAGVEETTVWGVRAFRAAYERVPRQLRKRISQVVALHVSFVLRAQIYVSSMWMECGDYGKLIYCDLISDLEGHLGVDALLSGLDDIDVEYDGVMRTWVARDDEIRPPKIPDPSNPLLDLTSVDFSRDVLDPSQRLTASLSAFVSHTTAAATPQTALPPKYAMPVQDLTVAQPKIFPDPQEKAQ